MKRKPYGYNNYRGRMTLEGFLKGLIIALAVILALVLLCYVLFERYAVYTDDGVRLDLPFLRDHTDPKPSQSVNIVVDPAGTDSPEPSAAAPDTAADEPLRAVWLPLTALAGGTAAEQAEQQGGNAVILDMKLEDGSLGYHSQLALADRAGANAADEDGSREAAIRQLTQGDLYTIARVCCLKDSRLYTADRELNILTNSGYLWRDTEENCWVNPANQEVRDYLAGIAGELAQLGFDEILLDFAGYPTQGNLGWIAQGDSYPAGALDGVIGGLYEQIARALEPYEVKLSIRTTEAALTGGENDSGQTPENLAAWADRIWVEPMTEEGAETAWTALTSAGLPRNGETLVTIDGQGGTEENWAMLP